MLFIYSKYTSRNSHENKLRNSLYRIGRRIAKLAKIDIYVPTTKRTVAADRAVAIRANYAHLLLASIKRDTTTDTDHTRASPL